MELKEPELFDYLKEFYYSDLEKSEEFDNWDCISLKDKMFIELKSRKTHYPDLLIEESKYQGLLLAAGIRSLKTNRTKLVGFLKLEEGILF